MDNSKKNNSNLSTWLFVFLSCVFIVTIGYRTQNKSDVSEVHKKITNDHKLVVESKENIQREPSLIEITDAYVVIMKYH